MTTRIGCCKTKLGKGTDVLPAAGKENKTSTSRSQSPVAPPKPAAAPAPSAEQRTEAQGRRRPPAPVRSCASRSNRRSRSLDEQIAKLHRARKPTLMRPAGRIESIYDAANKAKLKQLLADQTFHHQGIGRPGSRSGWNCRSSWKHWLNGFYLKPPAGRRTCTLLDRHQFIDVDHDQAAPVQVSPMSHQVIHPTGARQSARSAPVLERRRYPSLRPPPSPSRSWTA